MNVYKTGNKTLSDSDNSGVGTSLKKSFIKTRIVNLLRFQVDLLLESHVCCVNQKFTAYSFHHDFNTSIYTLNDFLSMISDCGAQLYILLALGKF